jgi:thiol-disulfide isomerase/thioredoxin
MCTIPCFRGVLVVGVICLATWQVPIVAGPDQTADAKVTLQDLKYDELGKLIRANKGKVIVVDFWADYCVPCKKAFPHLVEMHNKFDKKKVAVISVTVDPRGDAEQVAMLREAILKFLNKNKATMTNVWLDEPAEVWQEKTGINAVPFMYIFDKDNKIVKKLAGEEYNPTLAENLVEELAGK